MTPNLVELVSRIEAASGPERELDHEIADAVLGPVKPPYVRGKCERYTASLDAAMSLVPEGCVFTWDGVNMVATVLRSPPSRWDHGYHKLSEASAATPALALCSAALRSRSLTDEER